MKIHSLRGRLHMQICDFEHRERMWKTGPAQAHGASPKKGSVHRIIETVLLVPITDDLYRETGKVIRYRQTLTAVSHYYTGTGLLRSYFCPIREPEGYS